MGELDGQELDTKEKLWILNQRLRQVRFEQLTNYYKAWVIAVEALTLGVGIIWLLGVVIPPYSVDAVLELTQTITTLFVAVTIAVTLGLRVAWIVVTGSLPSFGQIEDWEI